MELTMTAPATVTTSPRPLRVDSARDLGPLFTNNPHRMIGQDGAFSIPLEPGKSLWFFGDTLIGKRTPGLSLWYSPVPSPSGTPEEEGRGEGGLCAQSAQNCTLSPALSLSTGRGSWQSVGHADMTGRNGIDRMINNTGLILRHRTGAESLDDFNYICDENRQLRALIPLDESEHRDWDRIWCQHGIKIGALIYLSFIKVRMLETPGPMPVNFEIVGSGLAVGDDVFWRWRRITHNGDSILWKATQPHFATAFLAEDDGWIYLYGTVNRDCQLCYLARVRWDEIQQLDRYQYLSSTSPGWSRDIADAMPIFDSMPSELSLSFNTHLNCYLAVHSLDLTGKIVARTAPDPWGPWSEPTVLWTVEKKPHPWPYPVLIYAGKEHPELAADNGRKIYLTYIEFEEYFPHLVEVSLA
jgi:hypothetical protein